MTSRGKLIIGGVGAVVLGGAVWGWSAWRAGGNRSTLPRELSVQALEAVVSDPGAVFERARKAMEEGNLAEEQRRELWQNVRTVMEARMDRRLDEYFAAADPAQKRTILDRHLDEMQTHMKEWERRRAERERQGGGRSDRTAPQGAQGRGPGAPPGFGPGPGDPPPDGPRGEGRPPGPPSREHRKLRSESRDPDQTARRMAYFTALRERAKERGIELPRFGPPR